MFGRKPYDQRGETARINVALANPRKVSLNPVEQGLGHSPFPAKLTVEVVDKQYLDAVRPCRDPALVIKFQNQTADRYWAPARLRSVGRKSWLSARTQRMELARGVSIMALFFEERDFISARGSRVRTLGPELRSNLTRE